MTKLGSICSRAHTQCTTLIPHFIAPQLGSVTFGFSMVTRQLQNNKLQSLFFFLPRKLGQLQLGVVAGG